MADVGADLPWWQHSRGRRAAANDARARRVL